MSSPFDGIDWAEFMRTFPVHHRPQAPKLRDPILPLALKRGLMMMYLNEMKPTKAPKKIAEMEKISRLVRRFVA